MEQERLQRVREIFDALSTMDGSIRVSELERLCGGDQGLRREVESLLASQEAAGSFLGTPAAGQAFGASLLAADHGQDAAGLVGRSFGQYRVTRLLGQGGMGVVYRAEQDRPRRAVALKLIRSPFVSQGMQRRFEHEAQILGRLKHPGIAQVFEAGSIADERGRPQPFFAMELVDGPPLMEFAEQHKLGSRDRLELFAQICDAVEHAHQKGVIHRDLKPGNILVETTGDTTGDTQGGGSDASSTRLGRTALPWQPKILDFGVARATDADVSLTTMQTGVGQLLGTLQYMSPEQVRGDVENVDTRSDVYALGVILYQLLTGRRPYDLRGKSLADAARIIGEEDPTRLSLVERTLRGDVETIVGKALEKDPSRRYASAAALGADVRRFLADLPIVARPATTGYQFRKFARRNKGLVGGVIAAMAMLVVGMIGTTAGLLKSQASLARMEQANTYLRETIKWFRPGTVQGPTVSLKDVMNSVGDRIDKELGSEPELAAFMHQAVGDNLLLLGEHAQAIAHARRAQECWAGARGPDCDGVFESVMLEAQILRSKTDYVAGEAVLRALVARLSTRAGAHTEQIAQARALLGAMLRGAKKPGEAEKELLGALEAVPKLDARSAKVWMEACNELGMLYRKPKPEQAVVYMRRAFDAAKLDPDSQDEHLATLTNNLATALRDSGDFDEAERLFRESLALRRKLYGDEHPATALAVSNLGTMQIRRGDTAGAMESFQNALDVRTRLLGADNRLTLVTKENVARIHNDRGRPDLAAEMLRQIVEARVRTDGPDAHDTLRAKGELAKYLLGIGQLDEAEALITEALKGLDKEPADTDDRFVTRQSLASLLRMRGRPEEALRIHREYLAWLDTNAPTRWDTRTGLLDGIARCLHAMGKLEDAEAAGRELITNIRRYAQEQSLLLARARQTLAAILIDRGAFQEAVSLLSGALASLQADPQVTPLRVAGIRSDLAEAHLGMKNAPDAEQELLGAWSLVGALDDAGAEPVRRSLRAKLRAFYADQGRPEAAAKYAEPPPAEPAPVANP